MKKYITLFAMISLLTGTAALQSGCASTPTKESTGEFIDDASITTRVKAALVKDDTVKAREVNVETFKGVVQLSGFVSTAEERSRAGQLAAAVRGVQAVTNNIQLK
jgi:hyperosmotically inducible protein